MQNVHDIESRLKKMAREKSSFLFNRPTGLGLKGNIYRGYTYDKLVYDMVLLNLCQQSDREGAGFGIPINTRGE